MDGVDAFMRFAGSATSLSHAIFSSTWPWLVVLLFGWSGGYKLLAPRLVAATLKDLGLTKSPSSLVGVSVGLLEIGAASLTLLTLVAIPQLQPLAAWTTLIFLGLTLLVSLWAVLARSGPIACNCFNSTSIFTRSTVARNGILVAAALLATVNGVTQQTPVSLALGACVALAVVGLGLMLFTGRRVFGDLSQLAEEEHENRRRASAWPAPPKVVSA